MPRTTQEEVDFADFDLFDDPATPYSTFNFKYTHEQFDRLAKLTEFNTLLNLDQIKDTIRQCIQLKRENPRQGPLGHNEIKLLRMQSIKKLKRRKKILQRVESYRLYSASQSSVSSPETPYFQASDEHPLSQASLEKVHSLGSLEKVESLGSLENVEFLGSLEKVQSLGSLENVEFLGSLEKVQSLGSLDNVQSLGSLENVQSLGSLDNVQSSASSENVNGQSSSQEMDDLMAADRLKARRRTLTRQDTLGSLNSITETFSLHSPRGADAHAVHPFLPDENDDDDDDYDDDDDIFYDAHPGDFFSETTGT